jgi:hypothetical protein
LIPHPPDRAFDQSVQFVCGTVDGLVQGRCVVSDGNGLTTLKTGFHHAALVILGALVAALVGQVDFNPRDMIADGVQCTLYYATDVSGQRLVTFDVVVSIDLYLHRVLLLYR